MTDPKRLLDDPSSLDLTRDLLQAARRREPSERARRRALSAVSVATATVATTKAAALTGTSLAKWLVIGALARGATVAASEVLTPAPTALVDAASVDTSRRAPRVMATAPAATSSPTASEPSSAPTRSAAPTKEFPAAPATNVTPGTARPSLADERIEVDAINRALRGGSPNGALDRIAGYRERFPKGAFGVEVMVLRIEALNAAGRHAEAKAAARSFLSRYPKSPAAKRVRTLAGL